MNIEELRKEIDKLDSELKSLLEKRLELCKQIGLIKKQNELPIVDKKRQRIVENCDNVGEFSQEIEKIYKEITNQAIKVQKKL